METSVQAEALAALRDDYDFWTEVGLGRPVDIRAGPEQVDSLTAALEQADISYSLMIQDVGVLVEVTKMTPLSPEVREAQGHSMDWTQYHPIEDMHSYLTYLQVSTSQDKTRIIFIIRTRMTLLPWSPSVSPTRAAT